MSKVKHPRYRTIRCRASKGLTKWCFGLCQPNHGIGFCGRPAPHALKGRTQRAIQEFNERKKKADAEELTPVP